MLGSNQMRSDQVYLIGVVYTGRGSPDSRETSLSPSRGSLVHDPMPVTLTRLNAVWRQQISTVRDQILRTAETSFALRGHYRN
jgi:hypothetical protein